jgi:8-oxo-dGTP pyrophosphatase MutT (NUDIX family)
MHEYKYVHRDDTYDTYKKLLSEISEFKAGFIIRAPVAGVESVLMVHQSTGRWGFPKGTSSSTDISPYDTAIRETQEETGIQLARDLKSGAATYSRLRFAPIERSTLTIFHTAIYTTKPAVSIDGDEIIGYEWIPVSLLQEVITTRKSSPNEVHTWERSHPISKCTGNLIDNWNVLVRG